MPTGELTELKNSRCLCGDKRLFESTTCNPKMTSLFPCSFVEKKVKRRWRSAGCSPASDDESETKKVQIQTTAYDDVREGMEEGPSEKEQKETAMKEIPREAVRDESRGQEPLVKIEVLISACGECDKETGYKLHNPRIAAIFFRSVLFILFVYVQVELSRVFLLSDSTATDSASIADA